ncbi:MAG: SRPBCC family protein [Gammaproteobacteria bacterium]|nr:SRPBCC family protein [Gammaproteobacteria bacterium]
MMRLALLALALAGAGEASAEVQSTGVSHTGERYHVSVTSYVPAPPRRVMALLTDYEGFERLHPMVRDSRLIGHEAGGARVRTTYRDCPIVIYCVEFSHTSLFTRVSEGLLVAQADPTASDFAYGRFEWTVLPEGDGTRLTFLSEVEPEFWVPPVIGGWVLRHRLTQVAEDIHETIKALAMKGELPTEHLSAQGEDTAYAPGR